jgi:guanosine-3',5'-bis(diphosphate) 3'-pyrophosphohydrolase
MDEWLANIRAASEAGDNLQVMDQFKMSLQPDDIYVFTPRGDLFKFPAHSTVLDFAYRIHSNIGNTCVGGKVNGKVVQMRQELHSGDTCGGSHAEQPETEARLAQHRRHAKG